MEGQRAAAVGQQRACLGLMKARPAQGKRPGVRHPTGHPSSCLHSRSGSRITQRSGRDSSGSSKQQQHRPAPRMYAAACSVPMTWYFRAFGDGPMGLLPSCENPQLSAAEDQRKWQADVSKQAKGGNGAVASRTVIATAASLLQQGYAGPSSACSSPLTGLQEALVVHYCQAVHDQQHTLQARAGGGRVPSRQESGGEAAAAGKRPPEGPAVCRLTCNSVHSVMAPRRTAPCSLSGFVALRRGVVEPAGFPSRAGSRIGLSGLR